MNRAELLRLWPLWLASAIAVVGYQLQHGRYYIHFMDDAWVMSWAWHWLRDGTENDHVFRDGSYVVVFGKLMWALYGVSLDALGWTKNHALQVSTACIYGAGLCWYFIGRQLQWSVERAAILGLTVVMLDKVVEAGCLCRADALVLLCVSAALLAFTKRRYLLAGLLAVGGAEIHPIALTALFYILAWAWSDRAYLLADKRRTAKQVGWFAAGAALGLGVYVALHYDALFSGKFLEVMKGSDKFAGRKRTELTYLDRHFKWHSHHELLVFCFGALAWLQQKLWRDNPFPFAALLCVVGSAFLVSRSNGFYAVMAFPAFAVVCVHALGKAKVLRAAFLILVLSFMLETHTRVTAHPQFQPDSSAAKLLELVPDDGLPVVGMNDFWFTFRERPFLPGDFHDDYAALLNTPAWRDVYLLDSSFESNRYVFGRIKRHLKRHFKATEIGSFKEHGSHTLRVTRYKRRTTK